MKNILAVIAVSLFALITEPAHAETWGTKHFTYYGAANAVTYVGFNPRNTPVPPGEQLNFQFYGSPDPAAGCPGTLVVPMQDGPVASVGFTSVQANTGLVSTNSAMTWAPTAGPNCLYPYMQGWAHAHLENANTVGGIGIYSHSGPKPSGSSQVFFQATPVSVTSPVAYSGIIVAFNKATALENLPKPFTGNSTDNNVRRVAVVTVQGVEKFGIDNPGSQVRQQTEINLIHKGCAAKAGVPDKMCEIQVQFMNAISGSNSSDPYAQVMFDGGQGGKVVFGGNYRSYSLPTMWANPQSGSHQVWTSWANPTQSGAFTGDMRFQAEITFNNLINMMCIAIAAKIGQPNATLITAAQAQHYFGGASTSYADPSEWVLKTAVISHEVVNVDQAASRAYIGGRLKSLEVLALPF